MDFSHALSRARWRHRFETESEVLEAARRAGRAPDATVDEVGVPAPNRSFDGRREIASPTGNGQGSGNPTSPGWAGWGA